MLKDFVDEKFEEQKQFIDGKFEEQEKFIRNQFDKQAKYIDESLADVEEKIEEAKNENNFLQVALYEAQMKNYLSQKQEIEDEFKRLSDSIDKAVDDLKDFYQDIKVIENSIDAESLLQELEEKLTFLQVVDNTHVDDHIADAIDRRINTMGRTYEVNRIKNNFDRFCVNNQLRAQCKQTTLQKNLCYGVLYTYIAIEKYRHTTLIGLINLLEATNYRDINVGYLEVQNLRKNEMIEWTSHIFEHEETSCPMFFTETHYWGNTEAMEIAFNDLSDLNPSLKKYFATLDFVKCNTFQTKFRKDCCHCDEDGSESLLCDAIDGDYENGQCTCNSNTNGISGLKCDSCADGYYLFPDCHECNCHDEGIYDATCDDNGQCNCKDTSENKWVGLQCDLCADGHVYITGDPGNCRGNLINIVMGPSHFLRA